MSHRAAAFLYGLDGSTNEHNDVTSSHKAIHGQPGIHRTRAALKPQQVKGFPTVPIERCLRTLGQYESENAVEIAVESALFKKLTTLPALAQELSGNANVGGHRVLAAVLRRRPFGAPPTESYLESRFVQLCREGGLPPFERQFRILDDWGNELARVDFANPSLRVLIECDGKAVHNSENLGADLRRQNALIAQGWTVNRFTYAQIVHHPAYVLAIVSGALSKAAAQ